MNPNFKRGLPLALLLVCAAAAAAMAWPAHASAAGPGWVRASDEGLDPPEPPEPPDAPEPPDFDGDDSPHAFVVTLGGTWLGVRIDDVDQDKVRDLKLRDAYGALVTNVEDSSPASRAGLKVNDVVVSYQGQRVESASTLSRMVRETPAGRTVTIGIVRDGSQQTLTAKIESRGHSHRSFAPLARLPKMNLGAMRMPGIWWSHGGPRLGVSVNDMNDQLAEYFGVRSGEGVLVMEVIEGTPAEKAGLKAGDVITRIDGDKVGDSGDIHEALDGKAGKEVGVTVIRNKKELTLKATLEAEDEEDSESFLPRSDKEKIMKEMKQAVEEARRANIEARTQARDADREMRRSLRESGRRGVVAPDRIRLRNALTDLIEI